MKWRFLDQDEHFIDISTYPQFSFNNPTSSADRGLVDEGTVLFLPIKMERRFGQFSLNPELGIAIHEDEEEWSYGKMAPQRST